MIGPHPELPFQHPIYGEMIAYNPERQRALYEKWDFETAQPVHTTLTVVDDTITDNHELRMASQNDTVIGKKETPFGRHVASIPMALMYDQKKDLNTAMQENDKYFKRWLNDGDNYKFRTNSSKV